MLRRRQSEATIKDVARLAGVSTATVSRYFNDRDKVSDQTCQQVEKAIKQLSYQQNLIAKAFSTGSNHCINVLTNNVTLYGFSSVLDSIVEHATGLGYALNITLMESTHPQSLMDTMHQVELLRPEGLIVVAFDEVGHSALDYLPEDIPSIAIVPDLEEITVSQVSVAAYYGGYNLTQHLLSLGHHTVYHVSVPADQGGRSRQSGWLQALLDAGRPAPAPLVADWDPARAIAIGQSLGSRQDVTAVFAGNDEIAMGIISGLRSAGKHVPDDVSVVGFDDHPLSNVVLPHVTTYHMRFSDAGAHAVEALHEQIEATRRGTFHEPAKIELPGFTVKRDSSQAVNMGIVPRST